MSFKIIANWKMSLSYQEAANICYQVENFNVFKNNLIIAPPLLYLLPLSSQFPSINFAAQNITHCSSDYGPFTGEISSQMLSDLKLKYCIIGHSERRKYCHETNKQIQKKIVCCLQHRISPILCIGETKEVRTKNLHYNFLVNQLDECLPNVPGEIIIAYEPIWTVGSGSIINIDDLNNTMIYITEYLSYRQRIVAQSYQLVYGGSVKPDNLAAIKNLAILNGVLIGSYSLKADHLRIMLEV